MKKETHTNKPLLMAFFKSFQESLSSVSVSSILDTVSSTVSNTVDGVRTAVNDVTYTVSDQLTEQVNTIISKKQGEDEDKGKREEGEASSEAESRTGAAGRINSKRHAYIDEEEERREREKQEQDRRNEEEQWEWCYAPAKGWYRKRKDPNQKDTGEQRQAERQENKGMGTEVSGELSTSNRDVNSEKVMENNEGGQEDTISKTSAETAYCEDTGTEECLNSDNDQTHGHVQDGHAQDGHVRDRHAENQHVQDKAAQDGQNRDETQLDKRRNSTSTKPTQNTGLSFCLYHTV